MMNNKFIRKFCFSLFLLTFYVLLPSYSLAHENIFVSVYNDVCSSYAAHSEEQA